MRHRLDHTGTHLEERALEAARRIFQLEAERDALDAKIAAARREHAELIRGASRRHESNGAGPVVVPSVHELAPESKGLSPGSVDKGSAPGEEIPARAHILRFVDARGVVPQEDVEVAMAELGLDPKRVRMALYDMSSVKVGTLARTDAGLSLTAKGKARLNQ